MNHRFPGRLVMDLRNQSKKNQFSNQNQTHSSNIAKYFHLKSKTQLNLNTTRTLKWDKIGKPDCLDALKMLEDVRFIQVTVNNITGLQTICCPCITLASNRAKFDDRYATCLDYCCACIVRDNEYFFRQHVRAKYNMPVCIFQKFCVTFFSLMISLWIAWQSRSVILAFCANTRE